MDQTRVPEPDRSITDAVGRKASASCARGGPAVVASDSAWGLFGLVGWAVAPPTVSGVALGLWLDAHVPSRLSWTLAPLLTGALLGSLNAW